MISGRSALVFRVVLGAWLTGWFCNAPGFIRNFKDALDRPIAYDAFPDLLRDPWLAIAAYVAPASATLALGTPDRRLARGTTLVIAAAALFLCLHFETCNDATFVTSFWASLWLVWFAWKGDRSDARSLQARALAQSIVGLMFLGAVIGKLTPEHYGGEAFYRLYMRDNPSWPYPELRASLGEPGVRSLATWFARSAIGGELLLAACPLLPTRLALVLGGVAMLVMMSAWTFHLASVLACLLGLLVAAELLRDGPAAGSARRHRSGE